MKTKTSPNTQKVIVEVVVKAPTPARATPTRRAPAPAPVPAPPAPAPVPAPVPPPTTPTRNWGKIVAGVVALATAVVVMLICGCCAAIVVNSVRKNQGAQIATTNNASNQQITIAPTAPVVQVPVAPTPIAPAPRTINNNSTVNEGSGVAFSFASGEPNISDVNVHVTRIGQQPVADKPNTAADSRQTGKIADLQRDIREIKFRIEDAQAGLAVCRQEARNAWLNGARNQAENDARVHEREIEKLRAELQEKTMELKKLSDELQTPTN